MDKADLEVLETYTLADIIEIRSKTVKSTKELNIENIFMRFYLRQYRIK